MNLGHCIGDRHSRSGSAAVDAIQIAHGVSQLTPREPWDPDSVTAAEKLLGAEPRPVYCYVGCLHPGLGTVGLIFDRSCCDGGLQGVSRCDSGGLAGGVGTFVYVPEANREQSLIELSYKDAELEAWLDAFTDEIATSYPSPVDYARGQQPDTASWADARAKCIEAHGAAVAAGTADTDEPDRRVWTWEARLQEGPESQRLRSIVLSNAQRNALSLDALRLLGELPTHVTVITLRSTADGPEELFASLEAAQALVAL